VALPRIACWIVLGFACAACATPAQQARQDCERQVAREMGYEVQGNGTWRPLPGTSSAPESTIKGSGARIHRCVYDKGFTE